MYKSTVELKSVATALETLALANKYMCVELVHECIVNLTRNLSVGTVLPIYHAARLYGGQTEQRRSKQAPPTLPRTPDAARATAPPLYDLMATAADDAHAEAFANMVKHYDALLDYCGAFVDRNADRVMADESVDEMDSDELAELFRRDSLAVSNELVSGLDLHLVFFPPSKRFRLLTTGLLNGCFVLSEVPEFIIIIVIIRRDARLRRFAGTVLSAGTVVHAQVQTATLGTDRPEPARGAGRRRAAVGAIPANDCQRVPFGPDAQRPAGRPGDVRADEADTQPETPAVDVPAAHQRGARLHGQAAEQAPPPYGRRSAFVRHQASVFVVPGRRRSAPQQWRRQFPVVRVRFARRPGVRQQKVQKERRQEKQEKMRGQLFLRSSHLHFRRVFRMSGHPSVPPTPPAPAQT